MRKPKPSKVPKASSGDAQLAVLLEQLVRDPDDDDTGLVLADVLAQAGDPRGELAQIQNRRAALASLVEVLKGTEKQVEYEDGVSVRETHGIVDWIQISLGDDAYKQKRTATALLAKLLEDRRLRVARAIHLSLGGTRTKAATIAKDAMTALGVVIERAPAVQSLHVDVSAKDEVEVDVGPCLAALAITELDLAAPPPTIAKFLAGTHTRLERLELRPRGEVANVKRLLDGSAVPALRHFQPSLGGALLKKLFASPLAARLESLDLTSAGSDLEGAATKALIAAKPKLKKLKRLAVDAEYFSTKDLRALRGFCPDVIGLPGETQLAWVDRKAAELDQRDRYEEIEE